MPKTFPDDVMGIVMPAIQGRISELLEDAFKLAAFVDSSEVLEKSIDSLTARYFHQEGDLDSILDGEDESSEGKSLLDRVIESPPLADSEAPTGRFKKKIFVDGRPRDNDDSPVPMRQVKAQKYSKKGRPVSIYTGVSFSGGTRRPWVARFQNTRLGLFKTEEAAAESYESARRKDRIKKGLT